MTAVPKEKITLEEYFELDNNSEGRFEYFDGEVFEMGVHPNHMRLERKLGKMLDEEIEKRGCLVTSSALRVYVPAAPPYRYPDTTALCGEPKFVDINGLPCLTNPTLIVEILSPSTEGYDRGGKFAEYKSIESFLEYLLISQDKKFITLFTKHNEKFWFQSEYFAGETLKLESLECELNVDEIYQGINFESETGF